MVAITGCHGASSPEALQENLANRQALLESQREQLEQVPAPTKGRYMAIHSFDSWQNPYLTVEPSMLVLHVTQADANPTSLGVGGMLRPIAAREQAVSIRPEELGEAMAAIPQTAWPYGRVVALEEAHKTPAAVEPTVRRQMEAAINELTQLGIVVYDINDGKVQ